MSNHLAAALLWLRNHYDLGDAELKAAVLARIDAVLRDHDPSVRDMEAFRRAYPASAKLEGKNDGLVIQRHD